VPGGATIPGNITVNTPQGDIVADLGGILQEALNGNVADGPTIDLTAGTPAGGDWNSTAPPLYVGNIDLGDGGVIGGSINLKATGKISAKAVIARQNASIHAPTIGRLTVLGPTVTVTGNSDGGPITIIGIQSVNAIGNLGAATLLGQNVSMNGGAAHSTLGSSATATSTSQSASQQASQSANQEVASTDTGDDKNKKKQPTLQRIKRVTVILPKAS